MSDSRRYFLKKAGLLGLSGSFLAQGCAGLGRKDRIVSDKKLSAETKWKNAGLSNPNAPGIPEAIGPMDTVLLKDHEPRSSLVTTETVVAEASFPVIDVHVHHYPAWARTGQPLRELLRNWLEAMDQVGIERSVIMTTAVGVQFDVIADFYLREHADRFQVYCGLDSERIDEPGYPARAASELERCYEKGARGVGELTDKGYGLTRNPELKPSERLHIDDPRLDLFWSKCAELKIPVNLHLADHPSAWQPPDIYQERPPIFQHYNQYGKGGLTHGELLSFLPKLLARHPATTFITCHLANLGHDLNQLGRLLHDHPNLYLDISARDYEIGRQPRSSAKFLTRYSDRVLFGTDMGMEKEMYQSWWRLLESEDEYIAGRAGWRHYGLGLSDDVLEKLYRTNALKILNWS